MKRPDNPHFLPSDDDALAAATYACARTAEPLGADAEERLLASYRRSRSRIGATTTAAGTQTVELDDLPLTTKRNKSILERPVFWIAAAAVIAIGLGVPQVFGPRSPAAVPAPMVTREQGRLVLRGVSPGTMVYVWRRGETGAFFQIGSGVLGEGSTLPGALGQGIGPRETVRITSSIDGQSVLYEGPLPP